MEGALAAENPNVPAKYQKYFFHYVDRRSLSEKILNVIGFTSGEVGRSFALIAGVDTYPNLPQRDRSLPAAEVDIRKLKSYLRDVEFFDEIVVLQNDAVTDDNLKYFLQYYFPARLKGFPQSRFLFAYSGHGIQEGPRGYLLQASATSFQDKANSISLEVLRTMYEEIVDSAYQSLALINACHGGFFSRAPFGPVRRLLPRGPGAHAISAGGSHEKSWSDGRPDHGSIFFEKLFAGLEGRADRLPDQPTGPPGDGIITEQELYDYLLQEVQLETDQKQNPQESDLNRDGSTGSFFFLNRAKGISAGAMKPWNPNQNGARSMGEDVPSDPSPEEIVAKTETAHSKPVEVASPGAEVPMASSAEELVDKVESALQNGKPVDAAKLAWDACDHGAGRGCAILASLRNLYLWREGGLTSNTMKEAELYRKSCDRKSADGCAALGVMYKLGEGGLKADPSEALELFRQSCESASPVGCSGLGVMYLNGQGGLPADQAKAVELFEKSCAGGWESGCLNLGSMYARGEGGLPADPSKAVEIYKKACASGVWDGCYSLGLMYEDGQGGLSSNPGEAGVLFEKACGGGSAFGCSALGFMYEHGKGGLPSDPRKAAELYQKGCDGGSANGCSILGFMYGNGQGGLPSNPRKAAELYQKACDAGSANGCTLLGSMYSLGEGGLPAYPGKAAELYEKACVGGSADGCSKAGGLYFYSNPRKSMEFYQKACDGGSAADCSTLGSAYWSGEDPRTLELRQKASSRAVELYRNACDHGSAYDCWELGYTYGHKGSLPSDPKKAAEFYEKACDKGSAIGCKYLGDLYRLGGGGRRVSSAKAETLYDKACKGGDPDACEVLEKMGKTKHK